MMCKILILIKIETESRLHYVDNIAYHRRKEDAVWLFGVFKYFLTLLSIGMKICNSKDLIVKIKQIYHILKIFWRNCYSS